ncbi:MAG: response regulator [Cyanobacteria bacterium]|nr:response regulator [Cyanobacteriota bacterium]
MLPGEARILVAEDSKSLQYLVMRQFKLLGYSVEIVGNGRLAVERACSDRVHLIFMDVQMPELDGYMATREIREFEEPRGYRTPIVGMTAFSSREQCLSVGMDDFLQKPVMIEDLRSTVDKWLRDYEADLPLLDLEQFKETAGQLKSLEERLLDLRKKFELE